MFSTFSLMSMMKVYCIVTDYCAWLPKSFICKQLHITLYALTYMYVLYIHPVYNNLFVTTGYWIWGPHSSTHPSTTIILCCSTSSVSIPYSSVFGGVSPTCWRELPSTCRSVILQFSIIVQMSWLCVYKCHIYVCTNCACACVCGKWILYSQTGHYMFHQ